MDSLCASIFFSSGIWAPVIWIVFFSAHSQINFVKWWHMSENTLMWVFSSFMKNFKPRSMAFRSSAFMCHCFSSRSQDPSVNIPWHEAAQPAFEASLYMSLEIGGYCMFFDINMMLSLQHFESRSASFDSVTLHSKFPLDLFSAYVLHLSYAL